MKKVILTILLMQASFYGYDVLAEKAKETYQPIVIQGVN